MKYKTASSFGISNSWWWLKYSGISNCTDVAMLIWEDLRWSVDPVVQLSPDIEYELKRPENFVRYIRKFEYDRIEYKKQNKFNCHNFTVLKKKQSGLWPFIFVQMQARVVLAPKNIPSTQLLMLRCIIWYVVTFRSFNWLIMVTWYWIGSSISKECNSTNTIALSTLK